MNLCACSFLCADVSSTVYAVVDIVWSILLSKKTLQLCHQVYTLVASVESALLHLSHSITTDGNSFNFSILLEWNSVQPNWNCVLGCDAQKKFIRKRARLLHCPSSSHVRQTASTKHWQQPRASEGDLRSVQASKGL